MNKNHFRIEISNLVIRSDETGVSLNQVIKVPNQEDIGTPVCSAGQTFQELLSNIESIIKISNGTIVISNGTVQLTEHEKKIIAKVGQLLKTSKDTLDDLRLLVATN
jgi:hypothetical protein